MKNWIISLLILIAPIIAFMALKENSITKNAIVAEASNKPMVIKFSSPMCTDCKKIKGELEPLKDKYAQSVTFIEINATDNSADTQKKIETYGVTVVPTVIFFNPTTQKEKKIEGFETKDKLEKCIKEIING